MIVLLLAFSTANAQYNQLWIPDTLTGPNFNLTLKDSFTQFFPGQQTITAGINSNFWGPILIFNKGETVHMNVTNSLNDSSTIHWHGFHLPAVMDGGPHQIIPPGTVWQPYWTVTNDASTFWYHPHLHMDAEKQITEGLGGLIIVRDSVESALALPRTYGVDDIPVILTDRSFNSSKQFTVVPYGDSMITNGVLRAQFTVPAQVVRLRVLDAAIERSYNLGFSDGRTFYVIGTDGGLVDAPVAVTRFLISPGERVEILINCTGQSGTTVDLKAYNSTLSNFIAGGENFTMGPFANALGKKDFNILHLVIGAQNGNAITTIPTSLTTNHFLSASSASLTRTITISDSTGVPNILGPNAFILDHKIFDINHISHTVQVDSVEIWDIKSTSIFAHPFHIHDVEFSILSRNGVAPADYEKGWKDVVLVKGNEEVKFICRFADYADSIHPFMYHCHIALHEDEGMMGQFVVKGASTSVGVGEVATEQGFSVYPNPANDKVFVKLNNTLQGIYYVRLTDAVGRTIYMLPQPDLSNGIDVSKLQSGTYFITLTTKDSNRLANNL